MTRATKILLFNFVLAFAVSSCRPLESDSPTAQPSPTPQISPAKPTPTPAKSVVDVPNLANKTPADFEKVFGKAKKIKQITDVPEEMPGEYRLYPVAGYKDGLSVRFYKNRAVRFNLFLNEETESARDALLKTFGVDVKNAAPVKTQFVEKWAGEFDGLKFKTVYAMKKDIKSPKYAMVHAEIEQ